MYLCKKHTFEGVLDLDPDGERNCKKFNMVKVSKKVGRMLVNLRING